ncbi:2OG-Fe(II) oxygenase [Tsuneonella sp. HG249]
MKLSLAPRIDLPGLSMHFARSGAVSVPGLLPGDEASALARELAGTDAWIEIFRAGEKVYEMPHAEFLRLADHQKTELQRMIENAARTGLQYRYRAIRVSEEPTSRTARGMLLDRFNDLLNSAETIALMRGITGSDAISFADAQATDYRARDFLTTHDDAIEGKNRVAAYVYGLTSGWQADWGGLLLFEKGDAVTGFVPDFNVLRIFSVPSKHHVSYVAPWVQARRLSITGWLRHSASQP